MAGVKRPARLVIKDPGGTYSKNKGEMEVDLMFVKLKSNPNLVIYDTRLSQSIYPLFRLKV